MDNKNKSRNNGNSISSKTSDNIISVCSQQLSRKNIPHVTRAIAELQRIQSQHQREHISPDILPPKFEVSEIPILDPATTLSVSNTDLTTPIINHTQTRENELSEFMKVIDSNTFKYFMTLAKSWDDAKNSDILNPSSSYDITHEGFIVPIKPIAKYIPQLNENFIPIENMRGAQNAERISITLTPTADNSWIGIFLEKLEQQDGTKPGIFIKGIEDNSIARLDGRLQVFDELIEVNKQEVHTMPYEEIQNILKTDHYPLKLTVQRNSSAVILRKMGITIPNYSITNNLKEFEVMETKFGRSLSEISFTELIELESDTRDFGFGIGNGLDDYCVVQEIVPGSLTHKDGRLQLGDEILRVNNHEVKCQKWKEIHQLIASSNELIILVRHQPGENSRGSRDQLTTPSQKSGDYNFQELDPLILYQMEDCVLPETLNVTLQRDKNGSLGMRIEGRYPPNSEDSSPEDGIYVNNISTGGPAEQSGCIKIGDRIVNVNGNNLKGLKPEQALSIVKAAGKTLYLILERSPVQDEHKPSTPNQALEPISHSHNVSVIIKSDDSDLQMSGEENAPSNSGLGIMHEFYLSHLSESTLKFENDPEGIKYSGKLSKEDESRTIQEWLPRVGRGKMVVVAQMKKSTPDGSIGIEIKPHGMESTRTIITKISTDGPAAENGILQFGDELLEINGIRVTDIYHEDVIKLLKSTPLHFRIVVSRENCTSQDSTSRDNLPIHYLMSHQNYLNNHTNSIDTSPSDSEDNISSTNSLERRHKKSMGRQQKSITTGIQDSNNISTLPCSQEKTYDDEVNTSLKETLTSNDENQLIQIIQERDKAAEKVKYLVNRILGNEKENEYSEDQIQKVLSEILAKKKLAKKAIPPSNSSNCIESGTIPRSSKTKSSGQSPNIHLRSHTPQPLTKTTHNELGPMNSIPLQNFQDLTKSEEDLLMQHVPFHKYIDEKTTKIIKRIPFPKVSFDAEESFPSQSKSLPTSENVSVSDESNSTLIENLNNDRTELHPSHSRRDNMRQKITITKGSEGLGLALQESTKSLKNDKKGIIFIDKIVPGSLAWEDGRLQVGDEILFINNFEAKGKDMAAIVVHISNLSSGPVTLTVLHTKEENSMLLKDSREATKPKKNLNILTEQIEENCNDDANFTDSRFTLSNSDSSIASNDPSLIKSDLYNQIKNTPLLPKRNNDRYNITSPSSQNSNKNYQLENQFDTCSIDNNSEDMQEEIKFNHKKQHPHEDYRPPTNDAFVDHQNQNFASHLNYKAISANNKHANSPNTNSPRIGENIRHRVNNNNNNNNNKYIPTRIQHNCITKEIILLRNTFTNNIGITILHKESQSFDGKYIPKGIFIKKINNPIIRTGQLCIDDQILEVNDFDLRYASHEDAVDIINNANDPVKLLVNQYPSFIRESIQAKVDRLSEVMSYLSGNIYGVEFRNGPRGSGIAIEIARSLSTLYNCNYFKVFEIVKSSNSKKINKVKKDDIIIEVNDVSAIGIEHSQLIDYLSAPKKEISLVLCRLVPESEKGSDTGIMNNQQIANNQLQPKKRTIKVSTIEKSQQIELNITSFNRNSKQPFIISSVKCRSPSNKRNLKFKPGDELIAINGQTLAGYSLEKVQAILANICKTNSYAIKFCSMPIQNATPSDITTFIPPLPNGPQNSDYRHITIELYNKTGQDLGLVVVDDGEGPYEGIYIKEVLPNSLAASDDRIKVGCRIIAINDIDLTQINASFFDSYADKKRNLIKLTLDYTSMLNTNQILEDVGTNLDSRHKRNWSSGTSLDVFGTSPNPRRPNNQSHSQTGSNSKLGLRTVKLTRNQNESYGLSIRGGAWYIHGDIPLFVGKIVPDTVADKSGLIHERDLILEINSISTRNMTQIDAESILKSQTEVILVLSDENDPIDIIYNVDTPNRSSVKNELSSSRESLQLRDSLPPPKQSADRKYSHVDSHPVPPINPHIMHLTTQPPIVYPNILGTIVPEWAPAYNNYPRAIVPSGTGSSNQNYKIVKLKKDLNGWGLSISGGSDCISGPQPIRITYLDEGGSAKKEGRLKVGDEILAVNRISLNNLIHSRVVSIIIQAQEEEATLHIRK